MPREKNLKPQNERTKTEQREIAQKGGIASGIARRQKKTAREAAKMLLEIELTGKSKDELKAQGIPESDMTVQTAIIAAQVQKATKQQDTRAAEFVFDLAGETGEVTIDRPEWRGLPCDVLYGEWINIYHDIKDRKHSRYSFKGGRGKGASSFAGFIIINEIESDPTICGLGVRNLKDDIGASVYSQVVWCIDTLGLSDDYHCIKSPYEITKKSTGQKIYFRAGNEPTKIKSIRPPVGMKIGVIWIEEADEIGGLASMRTIRQSAFRAGLKWGLFMQSYNNPRSQMHWINAFERDCLKDSRWLIHHGHYSKFKKEWLGQEFLDEAEALKESNEQAYRHEYDGEAVGHGANVFENVIIREITDKEINTFEALYYGLDFGWIHPNAFNGMSYNAAKRILYIFEEKHSYKMSNAQLMEMISPWKSRLIMADSAEPDKIADMNAFAFNVRGVNKGSVGRKGSREYSHEWLAGLNEIVIDGTRCPHTAEEFLTFEYEKLLDGTITSQIPIVGEDHISAVRYGMSPIWRVRGM